MYTHTNGDKDKALGLEELDCTLHGLTYAKHRHCHVASLPGETEAEAASPRILDELGSWPSRRHRWCDRVRGRQVPLSKARFMEVGLSTVRGCLDGVCGEGIARE